MFKLLVPLFVCVVLAAGELSPPPKPAFFDVSIYTHNQSQVIIANPYNYGMTHESFYKLNLLTASLNGDTVTWISANCAVSTTPREERNQTLEYAIADFGENSRNAFYLGRDSKIMVANPGVKTFGSADVSETPVPEPIAVGKVFVNDKFITFVYIDGQVLMKPVHCLNAEELDVYDRMRKEEEDFRSRF